MYTLNDDKEAKLLEGFQHSTYDISYTDTGVSWPPSYKIVGFSEILMFHLKIFGLLLLVKIKVFSFIGKSLN